MPGDSIHLNTRAVSERTYDAIVVGSGISGSLAAKELCEKGLKVLLLERGRDMVHPHYPTTHQHSWELEHRNNLTREDRERCYVQSRHYSYKEDNKHFYINDRENPYIEVKKYDWVRADVVGGRSLLWARQSYRWSDLDFEANAKDGYGIDWPIRYKDIAPWYDYVETFAGISGSREGIPELPDGKFLPPFEMNCVEKDFKKKLEARFRDRKLIIGRTANLTAPLNGRGQCQARNLCHRGCPYGAYYSSNSGAIPAALATGNLTIRPHALVNRVIYDEQKQRAAGVEIIDTTTRQTETFYARIVFLNAATLATAFILLNSTSNRFPNGLGNGSEQVGRNLMDHHKGISATASVEGFTDSYYYGRRPTGIYIPRFRNVHTPSPDFLRGYHYGGDAARSRGSGGDVPLGIALKESLSSPGGWHIGIYAFGECLPYNDNRVVLDTSKNDPWGRPMMAIDCAFRENEHNMVEDIKTASAEMLEAAGYKNIKVSGAISVPGNANHEMGIARMGRDPKTSVLNAFNQMHEVPNVFITDGSCMTSGSCVNPSVTYMALTARACDYAVRELKKQNI